ncbi:hypothetical protein F9L16_15905 [Agarivorans sp. B2Z047]|uniref:hypothetical protein n=1 Tax=Agarivorans sp. B2Z047 TaxID=2652721 RepID=UPI00128CB1F4|nr:hypothetical protein [Agarivorans sp. B2Z047]MPW30471.1 hypothetical protein [Agarivorans sp. B2Z047]
MIAHTLDYLGELVFLLVCVVELSQARALNQWPGRTIYLLVVATAFVYFSLLLPATAALIFLAALAITHLWAQFKPPRGE